MQNSANEPLLYESQRPYAQDDRLTWSPRASTTTSTSTSTTTRRCHFNQQAATNQARGRRLFKACNNSNDDNLLRSRTGKLKASARASHLIENFGRFISSRNNILSDNVISSGGYERHVEHRTNDYPNRANTLNKQPSSSSSSLSSENYSLRRCCINEEKRNKTRRLLSALFNDKQRNKSSLLISLLRAPIVLAALFSLILVATLIVLYALSFQQHLSKQQQLRHEEYDNQLSLHLITKEVAEQQQQQQQQGLIHHINGRDLDDLDDFSTSSPELDENGSDINSGLARALTVQTECASYLGAPDGPGIVFKGIPFASPPIGKRRWKRPQPVWLDRQLCNASKIVEARQWRSHCAQVSPVTRRFSGHEDCLYLDIYTPRLDQEKRLPVMVYIHGGFLAFGSSGQGGVNWLKGRPSAQLASELQVVMVAFNYRLQALGFMTMVELETSGARADQNNNNSAPDESGRGNYGLWDQLVALNWIKRNIESFGGDPGNIVLFGPDSASSIPLALLATTSATQTTTSSESPDDVDVDADADVDVDRLPVKS